MKSSELMKRCANYGFNVEPASPGFFWINTPYEGQFPTQQVFNLQSAAIKFLHRYKVKVTAAGFYTALLVNCHPDD